MTDAIVEIEQLDESGAGIGRWAADLGPRSIRVPGVVPGERARVEIEYVSHRSPLAVGRLIEVERPHPGRRSPPCPDHPAAGGTCGGCPLMIVDAPVQRALKREHLRRRHGIELDRIVHGEALGYRMSSKRVVGGETGALRLGSFRPRSHTVAPMQHCLVDHPRIVESFAELQEHAHARRIEPFDERTGEGDLRYAWAKCDGEQVLLTLVTASEDSRAAAELPGLLERPAGIAWSVQSGRGNAIRGTSPRILRGRQSLRLHLAGAEIEVGPLGFLQPNPAVAARAYEDLLLDADGRPQRGELAFDLYAGAGVVARRLREQFGSVRAVEAYPESAAALGVEPMDVAAFLVEPSVRASTPTLVVANPPRAGMGPDVCAALSRLDPLQLTIMSCNAQSLARDLAALGDTHALMRVRGYDTLPQTTHLELVAWLQRRPNSGQ